MNFDRLLAVYHFSNLYHSGQDSRLYALLSRVSRHYVPRGSEEYPEILTQPGYETAREIFVRLVRTEVGDGSGYHDCICCGVHEVTDDAQADVTLCDECVAAQCNPREPCSNLPESEIC